MEVIEIKIPVIDECNNCGWDRPTVKTAYSMNLEDLYYLQCPKCDTKTLLFENLPQAVHAWNTHGKQVNDENKP